MKCANCYGTVAEMLAKKDAEIAALNGRLSGISSLMKELTIHATEVIRISDRTHDAWDATKAAIQKAKDMGY
jgi:hypothetical protein